MSSSKYRRFVAVTPHDSNDIGPKWLSDAVLVKTAGDVVFVFDDDKTLTLTVTANSIWPFQVKRINATGTTASNIFALKEGL